MPSVRGSTRSADLSGYCHDVASVVGLWLTELFGVHDRWTLERAAALGVAMQLTNIARDVGEDWDRGRVYLPQSMLERHGVTERMIGETRRSGVAPASGICGPARRADDASPRLATTRPREAIATPPGLLPIAGRRGVARVSRHPRRHPRERLRLHPAPRRHVEGYADVARQRGARGVRAYESSLTTRTGPSPSARTTSVVRPKRW